MNFVDFIKMGLPLKIPNNTAHSYISFAIILNIFAKQKSFLFAYFVDLDKKLKNGIIEGENLQVQNISKLSILGSELSILEETIIGSYQ